MTKTNNIRCGHCGGTIIQNYDKIYCIQCSREPTKDEPAIISNKEYEQDRRGDFSIEQRINRTAQERGRSSMRYSR